MCRKHEVDSARAHRFHQGQYIAARYPEAAVNSGRLQGCDNQVGIVHGGYFGGHLRVRIAREKVGVAERDLLDRVARYHNVAGDPWWSYRKNSGDVLHRWRSA